MDNVFTVKQKRRQFFCGEYGRKLARDGKSAPLHNFFCKLQSILKILIANQYHFEILRQAFQPVIQKSTVRVRGIFITAAKA